MSADKLVSDLVVGDTIYILTPFPIPVIKPVMVAKIQVVKNSPNLRVIHFTKPTSNDKITDQMLITANNTLGTKVTESVVVQAKSHFWTAMSNPPTVMATKKETIEKWMKSTQ